MSKRILGMLLVFAMLLPGTAWAAENTEPYRITVNLEKNIVTIYGKDTAGEYTRPEKAFYCSAGQGTPTGTFRTTDKYDWRPLFGGVYGQYATRITGHILFHSVPYFEQDKSTLAYEEYNKLGMEASSGCIRLTAADAEWIYEHCPSGTVVEMYRGYRAEPIQPAAPPRIDPADVRRGWDPTDTDPDNPWMEKPEGATKEPENAAEEPAAKEPENAAKEPTAKEPEEEMPAPEQMTLTKGAAWPLTGYRIEGDCYLTAQNAKQAFAHMGLTLIFPRQEEGREPEVRYNRGLYHAQGREIAGEYYFSLRALAGITGVEITRTPRGGFSLWRQGEEMRIE